MAVTAAHHIGEKGGILIHCMGRGAAFATIRILALQPHVRTEYLFLSLTFNVCFVGTFLMFYYTNPGIYVRLKLEMPVWQMDAQQRQQLT